MIERKICKPQCCTCPNYIIYTQTQPKKIKGVSLKLGERYCTSGKRTRQFKKSDPKKFTPKWCPLRKSPAELRIYCFKDDKAATIAAILRMSGIEDQFAARYAVRLETHTDLTAIEFRRRLQKERPSEVLGVPWNRCEVVEIDDGLESYCFYLSSEGVPKTIHFDTDTARKNKLEQEDAK